MQLIIHADGAIRCLYSDDVELHRFGKLTIARGSHVEPNSDGQWTADLSPVNGPALGPFNQRAEALSAEQQWLEAHWLHPAGS